MEYWLIWSNEHEAWWGPNSRGYACDISEAGRYTTEEAVRICTSANAGSMKPEEVMVPSPDAVATIDAAVSACTGLTTAQLQALPAGAWAKVVEAATDNMGDPNDEDRDPRPFADVLRHLATLMADKHWLAHMASPSSESGSSWAKLLNRKADQLDAALAPFTTQEPADAQR